MELGFCSVIFETDCQALFFAWNKFGNEMPCVDFVICDCRFLSHFESLSFSFVKRTENRAADVIANLAFTSPKVIWVEDFPSGLVSLHHADVLGATLVLTLNKICRWT